MQKLNSKAVINSNKAPRSLKANLVNEFCANSKLSSHGYIKSYNYKQYSTHQQGMSVSGVVFFLFALGIFVKLAIAIIPAQVGDYQFTNLVAHELRRANDNSESASEFMKRLSKQLSINASYDAKPSEMITITNKNSGRLEVYKDYEVANKFFGNVDIVNRFEGEIIASEADD